MGNYTPEDVEAMADMCCTDADRYAQDRVCMLRAYAATLRQQAGRVDEGMVERGAEAAWNIVPRGAPFAEASSHIQNEWRTIARAILTAALAQNTQGEDYSELGNKYVAEAVERLRLTLGELTENAGPLAILSVAEVRIRRLKAERARVPDGWKLVPIELTTEMYYAADSAAICDDWYAGWAAMLAAAPSQPKDAGEVRHG